MSILRNVSAALLATTLTITVATAMADEVEFMNWTYTEDSGRDLMQGLMDDFTGKTGHAVAPIGYAWKDINKNAFLRARTNTLPDVMQVQGRFLPT
ncbi:MAG: hypothetical protein AAF311_17405, partial [Pseudomonadota bacterium]